MAKGGFQRRRIQQKKLQERRERKRARRRRLIATWTVVAAVVGLAIALALLLRDGGEPLAGPSGCEVPGAKGAPKKQLDGPPKMKIDPDKSYTATFRTSCGEVEIELFAKDAPKTVNNFVFLAREKFYDGSIFHRVIPDFGQPGTDMIQGGDAVKGDGSGDPGYEFEDENMIPFDKPGYLAMANSGPGTNGSQFFVLSGTVDHLNPKDGTCPGQGCHSIFGVVTKGLDVVGKIAKVPQAQSNRPTTDVVLISVTIEEK